MSLRNLNQKLILFYYSSIPTQLMMITVESWILQQQTNITTVTMFIKSLIILVNEVVRNKI